jgi:hypothetical protein
MDGFIVVLMFLSGLSGHPQQQVVRCPDIPCIARFQAHAHESRLLSRLRVWEAADYAPLSVGDAHVWRPFIDEQYQ